MKPSKKNDILVWAGRTEKVKQLWRMPGNETHKGLLLAGHARIQSTFKQSL